MNKPTSKITDTLLAVVFIALAVGTLLAQVMVPTPLETLYDRHLGPRSASAVMDESGRYHVIYQDRQSVSSSQRQYGSSSQIVLMYQYYENGVWSQATPVTDSHDYPDIGPSQIVCDENGNVAVGWWNGDWYGQYYFTGIPEWYSWGNPWELHGDDGMIWCSTFNGTDWMDPIQLSSNLTRYDFRLQYLQNGSLYAIWLELVEASYDDYNWGLFCRPFGDPSPLSVLASSYHTGRLPEDFQLLQGEDNHLHALWVYNDSIWYRSYNGSAWSDAISHSFGGEELRSVDASIDSTGRIHIVSIIHRYSAVDPDHHIGYCSLFEDSFGPSTIISDFGEYLDNLHLSFSADAQGNLHLVWGEYVYPNTKMYSCRLIDSVWQTPQIIDALSMRVSGLVMVNDSVSYALDAEFFGRTKILKHYLIGSDWAQALSILASGIPDFVAQLQWHFFWKSLLLVVGVSFTFPLGILLLRRRSGILLVR